MSTIADVLATKGSEVATVTPDTTVLEAANLMNDRRIGALCVVEGETLVGCVRTREIKDLPREIWMQKTVRDLTIACSDENSIHPATDAIAALSKMNQSGISRLMVVENGNLVGVITLKDLLRILSLRVELEKS